MIATRTVQMIEASDWDDLVVKTYGRPYSFQQQDDCKDRGTEDLTVPVCPHLDYTNATVPEEVNDPEMGVSFAAWLARDPDQPLPGCTGNFGLRLWWERNFYPRVDMVANDLHAKGLLPAGDYIINIDW
jgi:hypothetical protein